MARVLVAFGTSEGQTAAIAERIADGLEATGHEATLIHAKHPPAALDPGRYDGVIVGASIHVGSHQPYVAAFVRDHLETLNRLPSAFFSVSLTAPTTTPRIGNRRASYSSRSCGRPAGSPTPRWSSPARSRTASTGC